MPAESMDLPNAETQAAIEALKALRAEVRPELHVASDALLQRWRVIEPEIAEVEQLAHQAPRAAQRLALHLLVQLMEFSALLKREQLAS